MTHGLALRALSAFEFSSWQGFFVPANTPREVVVTIQRETAKALKAPDLIERLRVGGNEPVGSAPAEFDARSAPTSGSSLGS